MNTSNIKAFCAAHKKAILIGAVVLAIAANTKSFKEGFNSSYNNQQDYRQQGMYGQRHQPQRQQGFFSRMFGGNNETPQGNYNNGGYTNAGTGYTANNGNADINSGYEAQQAANDRNSERFSDYMRDQGNYEDGNGNTYKMSSQYSNNYVNENTNEVVQTNDASYNPGSSYTALTPSSYNASSAPATSTTESGE